MKAVPLPPTSSPSLSPWECAHCTTVNEMQAVLCTTCERPRLATAAVQDGPATSPNTGETTDDAVFHFRSQFELERCK